MIYHYTTLQTANSILNNYRQSEDKDNIVFWASSIYMMNDPTEMQYGWDVLIETLCGYEDANDVPADIRLSNFMKETEKSPFSKVFEEHFYNEDKTVFVISFSKEKDYLPMWSTYGENGNGICLCFDEKFFHTKNEMMIVFPALSTLYLGQSNNDESTMKALGEIIGQEYKFYLEGTKSFLEKTQTIGTMIPIVSACIKDSAFAYENEKRVVAMPHNINESICFRTSVKGNLVPFVKIPIPIKSLKEIIVGPGIQTENVKRGLQLFLHSCEVKIPLSLSCVPYREI